MDTEILLGRLMDSSVDDSQEEVNAESLYQYDYENFILSLKKKVSIYTIKDYINQFEEEDDSFWLKIFRELIDAYSLNSLKMFLSDITTEDYPQDMKGEIIKLILYLKYELQEYILDNKITPNLSYGQFTVGIKNTAIPYLFKWYLIYTDLVTFNTFLNLIINEANELD